jgi:two-component system sensor histidine kinase SenX3
VDPVAAQAVLAVVALAALIAVATLLRARRHAERRVTALASRLDLAVVESHRSLDAALTTLERVTDASMLRIGDSSLRADRLSEALGRVPLGVVVCDDRGEVVFQNQNASALMQSRHGDVIAARAVSEMLARAAAGENETRTVELFGPPRRSLVITATPLDDGVRGVGAVAVVEDVSDRRRLDAVRRDFVANMSHELKTPIGGLGLLAETITMEDDLAVISRLASRMHGEALRVARIIDDLLDLSRIESEEAPRREPVPVHLVVAEAVERMRGVAEHKRIDIEVKEPPRRLRVTGDRRQLVSAVHHLVENAVKYSDEGSAVEVTAGAKGAFVEIEVRDHGIGIPSRDLERIFERFYRVDPSRARDTGGTGLGLSIVRHIAGNHRGEVRVESREGEGSTFTLRLPAGGEPVLVSTAEAG